MKNLLRFALSTALALSPAWGRPPAAAPAAGHGKVFLTQAEALRLAFPEAEVRKETFYLSQDELRRAEKLAGRSLGRKVVHAYRAYRKGRLVGTAYFDVRRVRTAKQVVLFAVSPEGRIERVEVLSFAEPLDYLPRAKWYAQFRGRRLDDELYLGRGIRGLTGATLTARATTDAARVVLAVDRVLAQRPRSDPPNGL